MPGEILTDVASLGVAGLLFVMWWFERQERTRNLAPLRDAAQYAAQLADANRSLLDVVRANTEALTALREELRSHRATEAEWLARLTHQLEDIG